MTKGTKHILIAGGIIITVYIAYKIATRPANARFFKNTNNPRGIPKATDSPISDVALNNIGKGAYTGIDNVDLYREPTGEGFLGIGFLNYKDHNVPSAGTYVGNIMGVFPDTSGNGDQWYKLSEKSKTFFHGGDPLYINVSEATVK